ncbi:hypothetical protein BP00DRAFT_200360 [Aspergillus indologenus CBS 114.80]|uniref:Uncharacterized protein n=1 Tax=Aspergillus indologenus CBS 114.80 TaxID=1450541 RepID=A0A2V5I6A7_9EURO|nr:hypothetical protein BP00DRAFT_200360 [Aspergillus indologenus CBS 114.80]
MCRQPKALDEKRGGIHRLALPCQCQCQENIQRGEREKLPAFPLPTLTWAHIASAPESLLCQALSPARRRKGKQITLRPTDSKQNQINHHPPIHYKEERKLSHPTGGEGQPCATFPRPQLHRKDISSFLAQSFKPISLQSLVGIVAVPESRNPTIYLVRSQTGTRTRVWPYKMNQ